MTPSFFIQGGAGGKGTWGKLGCELELPWVDPNDPNYESEDEDSKETKIKTLVPEMGEEDVRKTVEPLILEFFENNDGMEVLFTLQEMFMNLGSRRWMVVTILIELAMDHKPSHREMASKLISDLYQKIISQRDIGKGNQSLISAGCRSILQVSNRRLLNTFSFRPPPAPAS